MTSYLDRRLNRFCNATALFDEAALRETLSLGNTSDLWNIFFLVNWFDRWIFQE